MVCGRSIFRLKGWQAAGLLVLCLLLPGARLAWGAEDAPEPYEPMKRYSAKTLGFDRWENALDIKMTSLFDRSISNFASPTVLLSAFWNYRYPTDTYVGLTLSGVPQKSNGTNEQGVPTSYTVYYGGINLAQSLYAEKHLRLVAALSGGYGVIYARTTPSDGSASVIDKPAFTFVEPTLFFTFVDYEQLDIGVVVTYRAAKLLVTSDVVGKRDLNSLSFGLTFRHRTH